MNKIILVLLFCPLLCAGQKVYTYGGKVLTHSGRPLTTASSTPAPFVPSDIDSLVLWLKADAGVTYDGSGYLSVWADQSGNGNNATQSTPGNQPLYAANQLNGHPVINLNTGRGMVLTTGITVNEFTAFFVAKTPLFIMGNNSGTLPNSAACILHNYITNHNNFIVNDVNNSSCYYTTTTQSGYITYTVDNKSANASWYYNSLLNGTHCYNFGTTLNCIGYRGYEGISVGQGEFAEIIIYNNPLSTIQRQQVEQYLQTKYAHY